VDFGNEEFVCKVANALEEITKLVESGFEYIMTFEGSIIRIRNPYEGEIRVETLPNLDRNIRFRTEMLNFIPRENDYVRFSIGFNCVSPEAIDVKK